MTYDICVFIKLLHYQKHFYFKLLTDAIPQVKKLTESCYLSAPTCIKEKKQVMKTTPSS